MAGDIVDTVTDTEPHSIIMLIGNISGSHLKLLFLTALPTNIARVDDRIIEDHYCLPS
jgi:hypothetical protein